MHVLREQSVLCK